jgi:hypothetical protein
MDSSESCCYASHKNHVSLLTETLSLTFYMFILDVSLDMYVCLIVIALGCDGERSNVRVCLNIPKNVSNPTQENVISSIGTEDVSVESV